MLDLHYWGMMLLELLVAVACGGLIGYQREILERPAGFRTHVLVCVGAAVYMQVSLLVAGNQFDPGRIAAQVASGIGFLGAGTIIQQGSIVRGLTTAASLWTVAGIGLAAGFGGRAMGLALISTLLVYLALTTLRGLERRIERGAFCTFYITIADPRAQVMDLRRLLSQHAMEVQGVSVGQEHDGVGEISVEGRLASADSVYRIVSDLTRNPAVRGVRWNCR